MIAFLRDVNTERTVEPLAFSRSIWWNFVLGTTSLGVLAFVICRLLWPNDAKGVRIEERNGEIQCHLGDILPGSKTTQTIPIRNRTNLPVSIKSVAKSCSCLDAGLSTGVIPPGAKADLTVTLAAPAYRSQFEHTVIIQYSEGRPPTPVKFVGTVSAWILPDSSAVEFGEVCAGERSLQNVSFQISAPWPQTQSDFKCTMPFTRLVDVSVDKSKKRYCCTICFEPPANLDPQEFEGDFVIHWTGHEERTLNLLCRAKVTPEWMAEPPSIIAGKLTQGQRATFSTQIRHRRAGVGQQQQFTLVVDPPNAISAELRTDGPILHITGSLLETDAKQPGLRHGTLRVKSSDNTELLRIPSFLGTSTRTWR